VIEAAVQEGEGLPELLLHLMGLTQVQCHVLVVLPALNPRVLDVQCLFYLGWIFYNKNNFCAYDKVLISKPILTCF
jgi:hypothetical protein